MGADSTQKRGFFRLIWQILLFAVSSFMLLGVLPYQLSNGNFKAEYTLVVIFWILIWRYAYKKLFPKKKVTTFEQTGIYPSHDQIYRPVSQLSPTEIMQLSKVKVGQNSIPDRAFTSMKALQNDEVGKHLAGASLGAGVPQSTHPGDPMMKLSTLKRMLDAGLITKEDFEKKKADILADI
jgi:Short C-terminal domain